MAALLGTPVQQLHISMSAANLSVKESTSKEVFVLSMKCPENIERSFK